MKKYIVPITAIIVIGVLESIALLKNINGALLAGSVFVIGGICGYWVKSLRR